MTSASRNPTYGTAIGHVLLFAFCILFIPLNADGDIIHGKQPDAGKVPPRKMQLKTIIVDNYYPYTFVNQDGNPDGFSVDLIRAVAEEMGLALSIHVDTWDLARKALKNRDIHVLPMMAYSKKRDRIFDFSVPHTIAYDAFFTRKGGSKIRSLDDLRGKRIIVMKDDQAHDYLRTTGLSGSRQLIPVDSLPHALKLLSSGKGDAALMPKLVGLTVAKNLKLNNLELSPIVIEDYNRPFSFAVAEGNQALLERLSQGLSIVKSSDQYGNIYAKWFGALAPPGLSLKTVLKYIGGIILVFAIIGSVLLLWSFSLRRQVALRTRALEEEISERKQAEEALRMEKEFTETALNSQQDTFFLFDHATEKAIRWNRALNDVTGYGDEEIAGMAALGSYYSPEDLKRKTFFIKEVLETGTGRIELELIRKDGSKVPTEYNISAIKDDEGNPKYMVAIGRDITDHKQVEKERRDHIHFLETLGRINRLIQQADDMEKMLWNVVETVLSIFECDRAWLLHPCDPDAPSFRVPVESVRPGYPGAGKHDLVIPMTPLMRGDMADALNTEGPVTFGPGNEKPVSAATQKQFNVQSQIVMSLRPNIGSPWMLGMHQCAHARIWTDQEKRLFNEIGSRITDGLNSTLYHRELAETKNLLHAVLEQSPIPMSVADLDSTLNIVNPACRASLGIEDLDLVGKPLIGMELPWETYTKDGERLDGGDFPLARAVKGETVTEELLRIVRRDNISRWIVASASPILNDRGKQIAAQIAFPDVTERKQAEEALRESEEKYRTILESIEDGYYEIDMDGNFTFFNDSLCEIYGYPTTELMGMNIRRPTDQETAKQGYNVFNEVFNTGSPKKGFEWPVIRNDGTKGVVEASVTLRRDVKGEPIGFRGIVRDITEKHKLEAQLQQAQKMEAIGTLSGGIAHDFNNLLTAIQGRTSIMLINKDALHPDFEHLQLIEDYIERAADLTKQLLGFARGGKYEVKPTDLNELIKKENRMFGRTKKEIIIHGVYEENLWSVEVDRGQIEQVLLNLYVNAWQAMPAGGDLFIQTQNVALDDNYTQPYHVELGRYVKISVTDTGHGMDRATRERVFDPFFTTKEMGRGTGLGLASAYGIIKNHGGFINVYSEKGYGTTFNVYLPASERDVIQEKKPIGDTLSRGSETVLFVDDESIIIEVAVNLLERLGYKILAARSGKEAIDIYKENHERIDMVILDMVMPEMSGGVTYDNLKAINPKVKVLLSSGYSINGQATEILDRGCNSFVQKPFKMKELSEKLREILDGK